MIRNRTSHLSRHPLQIAGACLTSPSAWLFVFLLTAWGLRLFHLGAMSLWWDETLSYERARHDLATILSGVIQIQNQITRDLHPPLYFLLLHYALLAFGASEFSLRLLSTFADMLTVALLFPTAKIIARVGGMGRGTRLGVLTVLFASVSPFLIWYAQEARPYALVLFWSLLSTFLLLRMMFGTRKRTKMQSPWASRLPPGTIPAVFYLLALGATLFTHYLSFVLLPFHAAALLIFGGRENRWRQLALLLLAGFVCGLVFVTVSAVLATGSNAGGPGFVPLFVILRDMLNSLVVGVTADLSRVALLDLALLAAWVLGVASTVRIGQRDFRIALFLMAYLFLPPLALEAGSYLRPLYMNSRHLITISPAFSLGIALCVDLLARRSSVPSVPLLRRLAVAGLATSSLIIALAGATFSLSNLYFDVAYAKDDNRGWSEFVRERMRPDDILILDSPHAETIYRYYAPPGLDWISLPHFGFSESEQQLRDLASVQDAYRNHGRVWFLQILRPLGDPLNRIGDHLRHFGQQIDTVLFTGTSSEIILQQFVPRSSVISALPESANPVEISFGQNLQLVGFEAPIQLSAGSRGSVKLYWRLSKASGEDYGVSLRVVDDAGARWGQWDALPVGSDYPTSKWRPGQIVVETHDLPIDPAAPPGAYSIQLAAYHSLNNEPLAPDSPGNSQSDMTVRLSNIVVTRPPSPPDAAQMVVDHHADVRFGDVVDFVGYNSDDTAVHPGDSVPLTAYFRLLRNPGHALDGRIEIAPQFAPFWNRSSSAQAFTLKLDGRLPGDILRANIEAVVPGDAGPGGYHVNLSLQGLTANGLLLSSDEISIHDLTVLATDRITVVPSITHPMEMWLGDTVDFLGYDINAPPAQHQGDAITITLYWRSRRVTDTSYVVFTHLLGEGDRIFGQNDSVPSNGSRPTTSWAPPEVITDRHEIAIQSGSSPGRYTIEIGMYDPRSGARLPVFDANSHPSGDRILLDPLTLQ